MSSSGQGYESAGVLSLDTDCSTADCSTTEELSGNKDFINTVKPVNKGQPRERQHMVLNWFLFGGYFVLFFQECGLYLKGGLYSEVVFNTGLTVYRFVCILYIRYIFHKYLLNL